MASMLRTPPTGDSVMQKTCQGCLKPFQSNGNNHKYCTSKCRGERRSSFPSSQTSSQPVTPEVAQSKRDNKRPNGHLSPIEQVDKRSKVSENDPPTKEVLLSKTKEELVSIIELLESSVRRQTELARASEEKMQQVIQELNEAKQVFATEVLNLKKKTYADAARSPAQSVMQPSTLEARLSKQGNITRDLVDSILNSRENGPVAQTFSCKGDRVYLTFKSDEAMAQAKNLLQTEPKAKELFEDVSKRQRLFPLLLKNIPANLLDDNEALMEEINGSRGNEPLAGNIASVFGVFSHRSLDIVHAKVMVKSRSARDAAVERGRIFLSSGLSHPVVAVDPHREVRRCFKCQRYGHKAVVCKSKDRCGKCAGEHRTSACNGGHPLCVNCGASHHSGSRSCPVQVKEALRYADLFC